MISCQDDDLPIIPPFIFSCSNILKSVQNLYQNFDFKIFDKLKEKINSNIDICDFVHFCKAITDPGERPIFRSGMETGLTLGLTLGEARSELIGDLL